MKIVSWTTLVDEGGYSSTPEFAHMQADLKDAITEIAWPVGADDFAIYPESGKKRGMGNGVVPIKTGFAKAIHSRGWELEKKAPKADGVTATIKGSLPGAFDAHYTFGRTSDLQPFAAEWETGNVSSSHRAINRIGLGIKAGYLSGGVLILPTQELAQYLTDRIGNEPELRPYHSLWSEWRLAPTSYFGIVAVEQDRVSYDVPRIAKGKDGRAVL